MSDASPNDGRGFIDHAYYLQAIDGSRGFLTLAGWFSPFDRPRAQIMGRVRIGEREFRFPCQLPRPDVAAHDARFSLHCGFNVTLTLPDGLGPAGTVRIGFYADGLPLGTLAPQVVVPEALVAAQQANLSPLAVTKLHNLILNERERLSHSVSTRSLPVVGHIDPCFTCQLRCPLCTSHVIRQDGYTMQVMTVPQLEAILDRYGDCLVRIWLSLWGEPLLNKRLPALIERCKQREIWVLVSTNLSVPMKPAMAEALVRSGVDALILSIDGASQEVYQIYRQGGDLALVLDNIRLLLTTRQRLGAARPFLFWRYLEFDWNRHEIAAARALAESLGVDRFATEPGVTSEPIRASLHGHAADLVSHPPDPQTEARWRALAAAQQEQHGHFGCDYLYSSISINANGQVHPCCYVVAPYDAVGHVGERVDLLRNGPMLRDNRRMFRALATGETAGMAGREPCASCDVVDSTRGHVVTQASFRVLFDHLIGRKPMLW